MKIQLPSLRSGAARWLTCRNCLLLSLLILHTSVIGQVSLVKDINPTAGGAYAYEFMEMTFHNGNIYFLHNATFDKYILYKSDGSTAGSVAIKEFSYVGEMESSGDYLYFAADELSATGDPTPYGRELWRSDGTAEGTQLVKDIYPGTSGSNPRNLTNVNGTLFFAANNGVNGIEIWKSNGTATGTVIVKDILRVSGSSNPQSLVALNGKLYFRANDGVNGYELWRSDGTDAGTTLVVNINPLSKASSFPDQITVVNGLLYFIATDGTNGKQLWTSTGVTGNATLVKMIRPGANNALGKFTKVGSLLFFQANDGIHGLELWRSDGTPAGTFMVKDLTPGSGSATAYATEHIEYPRESNGRLYFLAVAHSYQDLWTSDGTTAGTYQITSLNDPGFAWFDHWSTPYNGQTIFAGMSNEYETQYLELWKTDGTVAGTTRVHENIGDGYYNNLMATEMNGKLYFIGTSELWETDGTRAGTTVVKNLGYQGDSYPSYLTDVNGELFFEARDGAYPSLWKTNGTEAGTVKLSETLRGAKELINANGTVYFGGYDDRGDELWKSDGTTAGTVMVTDLTNIPDATFQSSMPRNFTEYNGHVYFSAYNSYNNPHLLRTDGTASGTIQVGGENPGFGLPGQFKEAGGKLFFTAQGEKGVELYVYDGINNPMLTKDIKLHYLGSHPVRLTAFNGILYFQADNRGNGYELYRSNGTTAGTYIVKDIRQDDLGTDPDLAPLDMGNMMATSEALYFTAIRSTGANALWRSDGTATNTKPIFNFTGMPQSTILAVEGNTLTFALGYDTHVELWTSNGTTTGTKKIADIPGFRNVAEPAFVKTLNGVIYFIATDYNSNKLWRTDGTAAGTYGIAPSISAHDIEVSGGKLYLSGHSVDYGHELFIVNDAGSSAIAAREAEMEAIRPSEADISFSNYPNPFAAHFSLKVKGQDDSMYQIRVVDFNGETIESATLPYNTEHTIGQTWNDGLYVLHVSIGDKIITRRIVKKN
jgi:ELWxxDGT repeat protein